MQLQSPPAIIRLSSEAAVKRAAAAAEKRAAAAAKRALVEGWTFIATVLLFCGVWLFASM